MAQLIIDIPDAQVQRVRDAFTFALGLEQPATVADVKNYIIEDVKQLVRSAEKRIAEQAVVDQVGPDVDLT